MNTQIFVITEKKDVGDRDEVSRNLLSTVSVYGGEYLPFFITKESAEEYAESLYESYRRFEIVPLNIAQ